MAENTPEIQRIGDSQYFFGIWYSIADAESLAPNPEGRPGQGWDIGAEPEPPSRLIGYYSRQPFGRLRLHIDTELLSPVSPKYVTSVYFFVDTRETGADFVARVPTDDPSVIDRRLTDYVVSLLDRARPQVDPELNQDRLDELLDVSRRTRHDIATLRLALNQLDISSGSTYPSCELSNLARHPFTIDGVHCESMEGFLQALKFDDRDTQRAICGKYGIDAKVSGRDRDWKTSQTLYWDGVAYQRRSEAYQALLDRAYDALLYQNPDFRIALLDSGDARLTHSIGGQSRKETILTEKEFVSRLTDLRDRLRRNDEIQGLI